MDLIVLNSAILSLAGLVSRHQNNYMYYQCQQPLFSHRACYNQEPNSRRRPRGSRAGVRKRRYSNATETIQRVAPRRPFSSRPKQRCDQRNLIYVNTQQTDTTSRLPHHLPLRPSVNTNNLIHISSTHHEQQTQVGQPQPFKSKGTHFVHINARSMLNKVDEIKKLIEHSNASVLAITETWLDNSVTDGEIQIPGYVTVRKDRNRQGGGVCLYIKDNIPYNMRNDMESGDCELLAIDLLFPKTKPILVVVAYRPPSQGGFYSNLENIFKGLSSQETIIMGDFNTDTTQENSLVKNLNSFINSFGLTQLINTPTRVTPKTSTILDLILVSDNELISQSGVIQCAFSDHDIIYCTRKKNKGHFESHCTRRVRCMRDYSKEYFIDKLKRLDWFTVVNCDDVNDACSNFYKLFISAIDDIAPMKEIRIKQRSQCWFTSEILELIRKRNQSLLKFRDTKEEADYNKYKNLRNKTQKLIKKEKAEYIKNQIENNKNNPKYLWKKLKELGCPSKQKSTCRNIGLKSPGDSKIIFDESQVAEQFKDFFCNVASDLVKQLPLTEFDTEKVNNFYSEGNESKINFQFSCVGEGEVMTLLASFDVSKATGCDAVSTGLLRDAGSVIAEPLTHIINLSLHNGVVPDDFKKARVVPLYKKGDSHAVGNYRPISILPVVSKLLERTVHKQLYTYLCENNLIYDFQSGFRPGFSTDTALTYLTDKIKNNIDNGLYTGAVLLDLQKAFDTVNHDILCLKLSSIGASESCVRWFQSYLSNRLQFVDINGKLSSPGVIECGVPQGSILGPLLFTIYVNDMVNSVNCDLCLYADDSMLLVGDRNVREIEDKLSLELSNVKQWLDENKLSLHLGKTESILFGSKYKIKKEERLRVSCNGIEIESKSNVKYLGAVLEQDMSGKIMASNIISRINRDLRFMFRKASNLGLQERKTLALTLLQTRFDYGHNVYYRGLCQDLRNKLQCTQNKIIRFILNYDSRTHLEFEDFSKLKCLDIENRFKFLTLNMMHNVHTKKAPAYLTDVTTVSEVHNYNTRSAARLHYALPRVGSQGKNTFKYNGVKLWNSLPATISQIKDKNKFKLHMKKFLFTEMKKKF